MKGKLHMEKIFCETEEKFREIQRRYDLEDCGVSGLYPEYHWYQDSNANVAVYRRCIDMLYKKVAGFGDYDILEPAIKEIDIMNFQNETVKECVDVPFTIVGKEKETEEDKQKMEISDSFVTSFAIFVIVFGLIMLKICWI